MVKEKLWKHVYKDTVKTELIWDEDMGKNIDNRTAKNHPGVNAPIHYLPTGKNCLMFSDVEIPGLQEIAALKDMQEATEIASLIQR